MCNEKNLIPWKKTVDEKPHREGSGTLANLLLLSSPVTTQPTQYQIIPYKNGVLHVHSSIQFHPRNRITHKSNNKPLEIVLSGFGGQICADNQVIWICGSLAGL
ncbi:hypothetical protein Droror1_Dr00000581 [Drosera rotundifolia]